MPSSCSGPGHRERPAGVLGYMSTQHTNRLIHETSPYLLQHAHNPVDWYPWGEDAFAEARRRDCPILLSVGYAACHWCHVMERESFSDPAVAQVMNEHFVCVKVDREERPDVDQLYMTAVQAFTGQGGWPMTVFLTPDGLPFYGGTYFPPEDRYHLPSFRRLLEEVARAWRERRTELVSQASRVAHAIQGALAPVYNRQPITPKALDDAAFRLVRQADRRHGGFGRGAKFPFHQPLAFLVLQGEEGPREARTVWEEALRAMARGGLFDHVGGGFHRYTVDPEWRVPHFEKMLYDNAQLASLYLEAWRVTQDPFYLDVAERTLAYLCRDMAAPEGGFYATEDADSEGVEGLFYTWTPDEVVDALGEGPGRAACALLGVTEHGDVEGRSVLGLRDNETPWIAGDHHVLVGLARARETRVRPARDEKVIAAWNALTLAALARAAALQPHGSHAAQAVRTADLLLNELTYRDADGRLRVLRTGTYEDGRPGSRTFRPSRVPGQLEDAALLAGALLDVYSACGEHRFLDASVEIADAMLDVFSGDGVFLYGTPADAPELFVRATPIEDDATPSGNAAAAHTCLRLASLDLPGSDRHRKFAEGALRVMTMPATEQPLAFGAWLCALRSYVDGVTVVRVHGDPGDPRCERLLQAARALAPRDAIVTRGDGDRAEPMAIVCRGSVCSAPRITVEELRLAIAGEA